MNEIVHATLERTPLAQWHTLAVLVHGDSVDARIMSRVDLVQWCFGNSLPTLATEAFKRKVPRGSFLALFIDDSGARFRVL